MSRTNQDDWDMYAEALVVCLHDGCRCPNPDMRDVARDAPHHLPDDVYGDFDRCTIGTDPDAMYNYGALMSLGKAARGSIVERFPSCPICEGRDF